MSVCWRDRYYKLANESGVEIMVDRYLPKSYKRYARAYINYCRLNGITFFKMFTLTQSTESYKPNIIRPFINQLKKRYDYHNNPIKFICTREIQQERYEKYGEKVLHWHIIVGFSQYTDFDIVEMEYCRSWWKFGGFDVRSITNDRMGVKYIMKYISKSLDSELLENYPRMRRISMSRVPVLYFQVWSVLCECIERLKHDWRQISDYTHTDRRGIYLITGFLDSWGRLYKEYLFRFPRWHILCTYSDIEAF